MNDNIDIEEFKMEYILLLCLFSVLAIDTQATTHWMVTESGLIQPKVDSPFEMARPYDLLAFLNQDTRWDNINVLYHDLATRQKTIDQLWEYLEKNSDITGLLTLDQDCINAGPLNVLDWYTTFMEDGRSKHIHIEEFMLYHLDYQSTDLPDCKKISSLTFSMLSFDHLEGIIQKENVTIVPELLLPELISPVMTVDEFGHWIAGILKKNSSSWLHYNMASLYWRVRGNAAKAIECSRRAIHYAPREYKALALQSLGSILHRGKKTDDAIIVLGAAVDHDPTQPETHFVLASAYAVTGDFNSSLKHLDLSLELNPTFELALVHKYAVHCHSYLMDTMQEVYKSIHKLRVELREYSIREAHWLRSQAAFLRTMKHAEVFDYRNVENNCIKMTELTGLDIRSVKKDGDRNSMIQYFFDSTMFKEHWANDKGVHALDSAYGLQRFIKHITKHASMVTDFMVQNELMRVTEGHQQERSFPDLDAEVRKAEADEDAAKDPFNNQGMPTFTIDNNDILKFATGMILFPSTMKVSRNALEFDKDPDWPSDEYCKDSASSFPENVEAIFPVFLPFENKGIRLESLLTDKIGVPADTEHELPWHPPNCPNNKDAAAFTQKKSQKPQYVTEVASTDHLKLKLLEYVADGHVELAQHMQAAEIGQRIYVAIQEELAPKWILYTLSSLYWRVRGNNVNALHCLLTASRSADAHFKDIVLASLASVYLEMGYFDDALAAAEEAMKLNSYEPTTNFILSELNMLKQLRQTQIYHLKQVIRVQPKFMNGLAMNLLNGWACILKQVNSIHSFKLEEGDVCTKVEPETVCEKDGSNCRVSNLQCYSNHERTGDGGEDKEVAEEETEEDLMSEEPDVSVFDPFVKNMPADVKNKIAHQMNYETMTNILSNTLKGCGYRGCVNLRAEDLSLKEGECMYQQLQLGYWLHIISLRQLLTDAESSLTSEITSTTPSHKRIPDCRSTSEASDDFFLERMNQVAADNWQPILSLMQQFTEMFHFYDYATLGAKIANYIETKPGSWGGLVVAGWWCGAGGRGGCARRCMAAARRQQAPNQPHAITALAALLHMQLKQEDAKNMAHLSFYVSPNSKIEAFLVAISHTHMTEYEQAVWLYRYALTIDDQFLPAKACLHATMCLLLFGDNAKKKPLGLKRV